MRNGKKFWLTVFIVLSVAVFLFGTVFTGCEGTAVAETTAAETKAPETTAKETTAETTMAEETTAAEMEFEGQALVISGSTTLLEVSQAWAEAFMEKYGGEVTINGGGSGVGIADLINGANDLANSSRSIKDEEKTEAEANGIDVKEYVVLFDGIAVITSSNISVPELTIKQLSDIYMGKITNWKDVGGPDASIVAAGRDSASGTGEYFLERVVQLDKKEKDNDYGDVVLRLQSNADVANQVTGNDNTIGYIGLGYLKDAAGAKIVNIKDTDDSEAIAPTVQTVGDKTYPIARDLFVYANGNKMSEITTAFVDFMLGDEGQAIGEEVGFVSAE
ncbi:MAG: PstS family phosphate ABC transporter substrate-binding protein [Actinobacteria bacterium]|nr:PstS family phosphate ABC transporter substrate-binding protein [Actinomycetota bacterium]